MKLPFSIDLSNKVAVITGAGGVLCAVFANALAQCGARIALLDLDQNAAEKAAEAIHTTGGQAKSYKCDVLSRASLESVHVQVLQDLGPCDILINGAGGNSPKATTTNESYAQGDKDKADLVSFFHLDPDGVEFVFNLNFLGTLLPTQVFAADMVDRQGCSILNISSMNAFIPLTKIPAYSGAKAAVSNFTQWLAVHFAPAGIRVNALAPGFFITNQNRRLLFTEDGSPTLRTNKILAATPMGRFGEAEELVGSVLFLLSNEAAGFITGVVLPIDGGFSAYSGV